MASVATPWGSATVVESVSVPQRAGERRFATVLELLETSGGERLVRIAYTTDGRARRGPVTMRGRELARLASALGRAPELRRALEEAAGGGGARARTAGAARGDAVRR
jgi:hypothetical protein